MSSSTPFSQMRSAVKSGLMETVVVVLRSSSESSVKESQDNAIAKVTLVDGPRNGRVDRQKKFWSKKGFQKKKKKKKKKKILLSCRFPQYLTTAMFTGAVQVTLFILSTALFLFFLKFYPGHFLQASRRSLEHVGFFPPFRKFI
jgi:hypothetical protein